MKPAKPMLTVSALAVLAAAFLLNTSPGNAEEVAPQMTEHQRISYTLGYLIRHRIAEQGYHVDVDAFTDGMHALTADTPPELSPDEMKAVMDRLLAAAHVHSRRAQPETQPDNTDDAHAHDAQHRPEPLIPSTPNMSVQINTQIPTGRIDTASEQTRINQILSDNPNLTAEDLKRLQ